MQNLLSFIAERSLGMLESEQIAIGLAEHVGWIFEAEQGYIARFTAIKGSPDP